MNSFFSKYLGDMFRGNTRSPILRYLRNYGIRSEIVAGYFGDGNADGPAFTTPIPSHFGIATDDGQTNVYFCTDSDGGGLKVVNAGNITTIDGTAFKFGLRLVRSINKLIAFYATQVRVYS